MEMPSRREFLGHLAPLGLAILIGDASFRGRQALAGKDLRDERICQRKFMLATKESLPTRPIGEIMVAVGSSFIGTPYLPNALEQPGEEHLVVNLRGLDCVTFVENTLALSRCIKCGRDS